MANPSYKKVWRVYIKLGSSKYYANGSTLPMNIKWLRYEEEYPSIWTEDEANLIRLKYIDQSPRVEYTYVASDREEESA